MGQLVGEVEIYPELLKQSAVVVGVGVQLVGGLVVGVCPVVPDLCRRPLAAVLAVVALIAAKIGGVRRALCTLWAE